MSLKLRLRLRCSGLLGLLVLGAVISARAQEDPTPAHRTEPAQPHGAVTAAIAPALYAAAHDSLMRRVASVYARAGARTDYFLASQGSFGGLHRRVRSYAGTTALPVRQQTVKHKFGIELEKVVYYDAQGRKVLAERYEGHLLTRLELWEYPANHARFNKPTAQWLLVRGDYLRHEFLRAPNHTTIGYYYNLRPPGELL